MPVGRHHREQHRSQRSGWLRASVLGANDGIVSTASLLLGVASADADRSAILVAGVAALVAGAGSMAVGEYVAVSAQRDTEEADIATERQELVATPERELDELTGIYVRKGLPRPLAREVAIELSKGDVLAVHLEEELGITDGSRARPLQAAGSSASSFTAGALLPIIAAALVSDGRIAAVLVVSLVALAILGVVSARLGGARPVRAVLRVVVGGAVAMAVTMAIGRMVGTNVG